MNKVVYCVIIIAVMSLVNFSIRAMPFILFRDEKKMPGAVTFLGKVLPPAMMSFLLVYCLRSVDFIKGNHGLPEIVGVLTAMLIHAYKRNTLLSIGIATVVYMVLIRII